MERLIEGRWFHVIVMAAVAAFVVAAYSNTFHSAFQFDDLPSITQNQQVKDLGNLSGILKGRRGITQLTFALNYAVGGTNTLGYHLVNALIHIMASIAAYFVVLAALRFAGGAVEWSRLIAAFSALVFAVHPVQTQAVTYLVQRMESLAGLFYLLALLAFIKSAEAKTRIHRYLLYVCVAVAYALGFYAKEVVVTMPLVILLFDLWFIGNWRLRETLGRWPLHLGLFVMLVFFAVQTIIPLSGFNDLSNESTEASAPASIRNKSNAPARPQGGASIAARRDIAGAIDNGRPQAQPLKSPASAGFNVADISPKEYLYTQFNVIVYYMALLLVPVNQNLDYDFPVARSFFSAPQANEGAALNIPMLPPVVSFTILLAVALAGVWLLLRSRGRIAPRSRVISFFIFWFFIMLAPTSSFVPIIDVIFEHRVYLASLGFFVTAVILIDWFCSAVAGRVRA